MYSWQNWGFYIFKKSLKDIKHQTPPEQYFRYVCMCVCVFMSAHMCVCVFLYLLACVSVLDTFVVVVDKHYTPLGNIDGENVLTRF